MNEKDKRLLFSRGRAHCFIRDFTESIGSDCSGIVSLGQYGKNVTIVGGTEVCNELREGEGARGGGLRKSSSWGVPPI
jgi:hypothetical protein